MLRPALDPREMLKLWDRVVLTLEKHGKRAEFVSRVEDIKRNAYVLEMPLRQSGELQFQKGDPVEVIYSRHDAVYSFKASILDLFEGDAKTMRIEKTSDVHRTQRRKYVRLDISGKMQFKTLDIENRDNIGSDMAGTLLNISAGGVLFESSVRLPESGFIMVSFTLRGHQPLNGILAVVKRCDGSINAGYLIGAEFITKGNAAEYKLNNIGELLPPGAGTFDENLQRLVVQFIYSQQVELRKKGLLSK